MVVSMQSLVLRTLTSECLGLSSSYQEHLGVSSALGLGVEQSGLFTLQFVGVGSLIPRG